MKSLVALACTLGVLAHSPVLAEESYYLEQCTADGDKLSLNFLAGRGGVRRLYIRPQGLEVGGNVKGESQLKNIKELRVKPILKVLYVSGGAVEFGPITSRCEEKLRRVARKLSITVRASDG